MKIQNVAEAKAHFSTLLEDVQKGETVLICKRNKAVAKLVPLPAEELPAHSTTKLGWAKGSIQVHVDLTEPCIPLEDWEMLK